MTSADKPTEEKKKKLFSFFPSQNDWLVKKTETKYTRLFLLSSGQKSLNAALKHSPTINQLKDADKKVLIMSIGENIYILCRNIQ